MIHAGRARSRLSSGCRRPWQRKASRGRSCLSSIAQWRESVGRILLLMTPRSHTVGESAGEPVGVQPEDLTAYARRGIGHRQPVRSVSAQPGPEHSRRGMRDRGQDQLSLLVSRATVRQHQLSPGTVWPPLLPLPEHHRQTPLHDVDFSVARYPVGCGAPTKGRPSSRPRRPRTGDVSCTGGDTATSP